MKATIFSTAITGAAASARAGRALRPDNLPLWAQLEQGSGDWHQKVNYQQDLEALSDNSYPAESRASVRAGNEWGIAGNEFNVPEQPEFNAKKGTWDAPPATSEPFVHRGVGNLEWYEFSGLGGQDYTHAMFDPTKPLGPKPPYNGFTDAHESIMKVRKWDSKAGEQGGWVPGINKEMEKDGSVKPGSDPRTTFNNYMADYFIHDQNTNGGKSWTKHKDLKTTSGFGLAGHIKTGIDNPTHFSIAPVGMVALEEDTYHTFRDIMLDVTAARHPDWDPSTITRTTEDSLNIANSRFYEEMRVNGMDPTCKKIEHDEHGNARRSECDYAVTTRVRTGRSVSNMPFPPAISFDQRRELERIAIEALNSLDDADLEGEYFALPNSHSFYDTFKDSADAGLKRQAREQENGMSEENAKRLRTLGNMFQEPDSTLLLSSGCGRHWPDARGIYHNRGTPDVNDGNPTLFVWLNEEDHLRIVSMQRGDNFFAVFEQWTRALTKVWSAFKAKGSGFQQDDTFGWLLTCPSNLGTGMRAGSLVKCKGLKDHVSQVLVASGLWDNEKDAYAKAWQSFCGHFKLQSRNFGGVDSVGDAGMYDISNVDRIGFSEIELMDFVFQGVRQFIRWQMMLDGKYAFFEEQFPYGNAFEAEIRPILEQIKIQRAAGQA